MLKFVVKPKRYPHYQKFNTIEFILLFLISLLVGYCLADPIAHYFGDETTDPDFTNISLVKIISSILVVPVIEELLNRGFLSVRAKFFWTLPTSLLFMGIVAVSQENYLIAVFFLICLLTLLISLCLNRNSAKFLVKIFRKNFSLYFYFSVISFSVIHIGSIDQELNPLKMIIILFVTYFPDSVILSYARVKYGLRYSILLHSLINGSVLLLNEILYSGI